MLASMTRLVMSDATYAGMLTVAGLSLSYDTDDEARPASNR